MARQKMKSQPQRKDASQSRQNVAQPPAGSRSGASYPRQQAAARSSLSTPSQGSGQGWRASKRSSKLGKQVRRDAKAERFRDDVDRGVKAAGYGFVEIVRMLLKGLVGLAALVAVLFVVATGVNAAARWIALQQAQAQSTPEALAEQAEENLLIIGAEGTTTVSAEFLAVRLDEENEQVLGIGIPSGAFMEVPGQGYERVGDSISAGPEMSLTAISNYLAVQFAHYVIVDVTVYRDAMTNGSLSDVMASVQDTNLTAEEQTRVAKFIASVTGENTALVPLPVQPIDLGGETYYEPQRDQIADLLLQWWGVSVGAEDSAVRVIIYNGVGTAGIAGDAAQQLIEAGMRVVDTRNADRFDYANTLIVVQDGDMAQGSLIAEALGVGEVIDQPSDQDVADVIVIIGADYAPPETTSEKD